MHHDDWLDDAQAEAIAHKVREALARRRISRQALADMAKISLSTLEKALSGRRAFTLATVIRLEEALGTSLRTTGSAADLAHDTAPEELGGYSHGAVRWLEGRYLAVRPSFGTEPGLHAYEIDIAWDEASSRLRFSEMKRDDSYAQHGVVSLSHLSGHIYLVTCQDGQYRMVILGRPTIAGSLYGILSTLLVGHGSQLVPAACAIALSRIADGAEPAFGRIDPGHPDYAAYRAELDAVTARDFARFPEVPPAA
jgi:transcriptional regulator with XRE-family HTH domain